MKLLAVSFTNFGPYHLARLRALAALLGCHGWRILAYETATVENKYPWQAAREDEPFVWQTLFPSQPLESISRGNAARAMLRALASDQPDAVMLCGYTRPEVLAALGWAERMRRPTVLMSESQACDRPRVWWKEAVKSRRIRRFGSALVGGERHRAYLRSLGMPGERIALGYNCVDHEWFSRQTRLARAHESGGASRPSVPYFVAVSRFVTEKNLIRLIEAYSHYRRRVVPTRPWDLILCGDGPQAPLVSATIRQLELEDCIHLPGFMQAEDLILYYAFASGFIHASTSEPWGLVVNEAAACGLPLLVSDRCGCVETLVPEPSGSTGLRFDPLDVESISDAMTWLSSLDEHERRSIGERSEKVASRWGPTRFAEGSLEALSQAERALADRGRRRRPVRIEH